MNLEDAKAWLRGERSMCNQIQPSYEGEWPVQTARADAAMTQQAYWIVKAHAEGLIAEVAE